MEHELRRGDSTVTIRAHAPLHTTTARSRDVVGAFKADLADGLPTGAVSGWAEVPLRSFRSGNPLLDANTLRHIGVRTHPSTRFELTSASATDDGAVRVAGTLDFHGVTREIEADAEVHVDGDRVTIRGSWTLRQSEFELRPPRLAMLKVDDDVEVDFELVATAVG